MGWAEKQPRQEHKGDNNQRCAHVKQEMINRQGQDKECAGMAIGRERNVSIGITLD